MTQDDDTAFGLAQVLGSPGGRGVTLPSSKLLASSSVNARSVGSSRATKDVQLRHVIRPGLRGGS
jgi:hypothetical protein